jgi:L-talarate/galactarate dehydratase
VKIESVEVLPVVVPNAGPVDLDGSVHVVVAVLHTDDGAEGVGHTMTLRPRWFRTLATAVDELGELLVGEDPRQPEALHEKMLSAVNWFGPGGLVEFAACAVDIAVWDLLGKASGQPLYRLLGGYRNRVPAYISGQLSRRLTLDELGKAAARFKGDGWRAMKMNLGVERTPQAEAARVRAVREAVGDEVEILVDVNSRWTPAQAIRTGRHLEEYRLFWLEDPTEAEDLEGLAEIARELETPIATGEKYYGLAPWRRVLQARALDIVMVDMMRAGGITPLRKISALCAAYSYPMASHTQHEIYAHCTAAIPHGLIVEYMPWSSQVFQGVAELDQGELVLSDRPGHGMELDRDFASKHRAA